MSKHHKEDSFSGLENHFIYQMVFSWEPALETANSRDGAAAAAAVQKKPLTKADGGDLLLDPV